MLDEQWRAYIHISSVDQTRRKADDLLRLAGMLSDDAPRPSACAVLALGAALEQGIRFAIEGGRFNWSMNHGDESRNPFDSVQKGMLRYRMRCTPEVLSDGRLRFRDRTDHGRALHDPIDVRNALAHIDEAPVVIDGTDERIPIIGEDAERVVLQVSLIIRDNPWSNITLNMAGRFREAVAAYFDDVLDSGGDLQPGRLLELNR